MNPDGTVNILLVDDKPEKLLALEAVLEDLHEHIVRAYSGPEALRCLLNQNFAVMLLDVNMPGMDGLETASLIRQRKSTADLPIIFITAYGDEMHMSRGYSLGAVDFIQAPIMPDVLRTKVSVFVDLYRKSAQVRQQAAWMQHRAEQLHKLTAASLAINSAQSIDSMLAAVGQAARDIIGAHQAFVSFLPDQDWAHAQTFASLSDKYAAWRNQNHKPDPKGICGLVCRAHKPMRMTRDDLHRQSASRAEAAPPRGEPLPLSGWLAAPLDCRDQRNIGLIELSDRNDGDFSAEDEAILVQLAQMTSIAIENALFSEEREANRIKDEFLWTLSHELRTPLNAVLGWTQLLKMENLSGEVANGLDIIDRNARAQVKLIEDLLDVSRITTGKFRLDLRPTDLAAVAQAAVDTVRPGAEGKQITVEADICSTGQIQGDPDRLQQVIWNLLTNAIKFTPSGGAVRVRLHRVADTFQLEVADTGKGISSSFLPYVFDRFRQADSSSTRVHGGLGIGLTIARHIVELHGGTITAESPGEGLGATFTARIPCVTRRTQAIAPPSPEPEPLIEGLGDVAGLRVLLVDDDRDAREMVSAMLKRYSVQVSAVASMREAMEAIARQKPDLLISDIAMPHEDGYELVAALRQLPPERGGDVPALALTAYAREDDRNRALAAGFQEHLAKPVQPAQLIAAIVTLVQKLPQHA